MIDLRDIKAAITTAESEIYFQTDEGALQALNTIKGLLENFIETVEIQQEQCGYNGNGN